MSADRVSDLVAQAVYPATFVVCLVWVGIAIAHATNGGRLRYTMLALSMMFAALAFGLLGFNAGRTFFTLQQVLLLFRAAMTAATVFGWAFTAMYLMRIWRKSRGDQKHVATTVR